MASISDNISNTFNIVSSEQLNPVLPPEVIAENIAHVQSLITIAAQNANRDPREVKLMLVAKYQPVENLRTAINSGVNLFGHNLVHQLVTTEPEIADLPHTSTMIGHVQSNKLSSALDFASRIDTVDSLKMAQRIARRHVTRIARGEANDAYPILLQVNSSGADSQFGCAPDALINLAKQILEIRELRIEGLMTIGANTSQEDKIVESFEVTRRLSLQLRDLPGLADAGELSMGMSNDLNLAVAHGSTLVRIGRAVFGERRQK